MENYKERLKDISEIRSIMEQSTKFLSLSGLSGVSAGVIALLGACAAIFYLGGNIDYINHLKPHPGISFQTFFFLDAGIVLGLALLFSTYFSKRKAVKMNLPFWNKTAKHLLVSMLIPLITGGLLCLIQIQNQDYDWIASSTLIFYGLALLNASKYTLREIQYLGISQLVIGLLCAWINQYDLYFWAAGFGVFHIIYGIYMYLKYER